MNGSSAMIPLTAVRRLSPRTALLLCGALLGVALLVWGGAPQREEDAPEAEVSASVSEEMEAYTRALEEKIRAFCAEVEGVGEVRVAVSLESGYRRVFARDGGDDYVLAGSGSTRDPVYLTECPPQICGIAIVCTGGEDPEVCRRLIGLLSAAYGIGANKIYIAGAQN